MVVYEFSTVARQEATQRSAEVNVVFSAHHMKAVRTKKRLRSGHRKICEEVSRGPRHVLNQYGGWSPSRTDRRETALAQKAKHGVR